LDGVAGSGSAGLVPLSAAILAAIGFALALARRNSMLVYLGAAIIVAMPILPVVSVDFALRRAMVIAPFLAMFGALAVTEIFRVAWRQRALIRVAVIAILIGVTANIAYRNIDDYFNNTAVSQGTRWVLGPELMETTEFIQDLPEGSYVYMYSSRWPFSHETVRFLAPDAKGETRGAPYGPDTIDVDPARGQPVFVLMGEYQLMLPDIQARYPGGTVVHGPALSDQVTGPSYIAYLLPAPP
jgi:hypothetical protein